MFKMTDSRLKIGKPILRLSRDPKASEVSLAKQDQSKGTSGGRAAATVMGSSSPDADTYGSATSIGAPSTIYSSLYGESQTTVVEKHAVGEIPLKTVSTSASLKSGSTSSESLEFEEYILYPTRKKSELDLALLEKTPSQMLADSTTIISSEDLSISDGSVSGESASHTSGSERSLSCRSVLQRKVSIGRGANESGVNAKASNKSVLNDRRSSKTIVTEKGSNKSVSNEKKSSKSVVNEKVSSRSELNKMEPSKSTASEKKKCNSGLDGGSSIDDSTEFHDCDCPIFYETEDDFTSNASQCTLLPDAPNVSGTTSRRSLAPSTSNPSRKSVSIRGESISSKSSDIFIKTKETTISRVSLDRAAIYNEATQAKKLLTVKENFAVKMANLKASIRKTTPPPTAVTGKPVARPTRTEITKLDKTPPRLTRNPGTSKSPSPAPKPVNTMKHPVVSQPPPKPVKTMKLPVVSPPPPADSFVPNVSVFAKPSDASIKIDAAEEVAPVVQIYTAIESSAPTELAEADFKQSSSDSNMTSSSFDSKSNLTKNVYFEPLRRCQKGQDLLKTSSSESVWLLIRYLFSFGFVESVVSFIFGNLCTFIKAAVFWLMLMYVISNLQANLTLEHTVNATETGWIRNFLWQEPELRWQEVMTVKLYHYRLINFGLESLGVVIGCASTLQFAWVLYMPWLLESVWLMGQNLTLLLFSLFQGQLDELFYYMLIMKLLALSFVITEIAIQFFHSFRQDMHIVRYYPTQEAPAKQATD